MEKKNGNYYNGLYRGYIGVMLGLFRDNGKRKWKLLQFNGVYIGFTCS